MNVWHWCYRALAWIIIQVLELQQVRRPSKLHVFKVSTAAGGNGSDNSRNIFTLLTHQFERIFSLCIARKESGEMKRFCVRMRLRMIHDVTLSLQHDALACCVVIGSLPVPTMFTTWNNNESSHIDTSNTWHDYEIKQDDQGRVWRSQLGAGLKVITSSLDFLSTG